jgi:gluconate 5-dehydrogenase
MSAPLFDISGQRVLITGGSRGIGLALARGMGRAGAAVVINGRDKNTLNAAVDDLRREGIDANGVAFDVTRSEEVTEAVVRIEQTLGPIDTLINNAGMQHRQPLDQFPDAAWNQLIATNLTSAFFVSRAVVQQMIARRAGQIINICSVQSELGRPSIAPYAATKGALKMLTKGMAIDWGLHGIRANAIGPGYFDTDLNAALVQNLEFSGWLTKRTPLGRWGQVDELVGAAIFLASRASSFVTGQVIYVDGGVTSSL